MSGKSTGNQRGKQAKILKAARQMGGGQVLLSELRSALPEFDRAEFDALVLDLHRRTEHALVAEADQWRLTEADREAAVKVGGQPKHVLWVMG